MNSMVATSPLTYLARTSERWDLIETRNCTRQLGRKYLFRTSDNSIIETGVYAHCGELDRPRAMKIDAGVEIATQAGCGQRCIMCASGALKHTRNLSNEEMWQQISTTIHTEGITPNSMEQLFFVSAMGIGEPSLNATNVLEVMKMVREHFPKADINISTNGINPEAISFWADGLTGPLHLQLSLHGPDDETRVRIMPGIRGTKNATIEKMLEQTDYFHRVHPAGKIWVAYTPLCGINDSDTQIEKLLRKTLYSRRDFLTLKFLVLNRTSISDANGLRSADLDRIQRWVDEAKNTGYYSSYRWRIMTDIACGQLALDNL